MTRAAGSSRKAHAPNVPCYATEQELEAYWQRGLHAPLHKAWTAVTFSPLSL